MDGNQTREISFTLRLDNADHRAVVEWIDKKRKGKQRFRQLRDHIVRAMLDYIDGCEPQKEQRSETTTEREPQRGQAATASATAARAMEF